jgi:hypothetical protein
MIQENIIRSEFLYECNLVLNFLITDYGFSGPVITEESNVNMVIHYLKLEIAVEVDLDKRDEDTSVRIVRLDKGKIPDVWRMNKKGKIVKEYLHALLKHRGVKDFKYEMPILPNTLSKREKEFRRSLFTEGYWLKRYGQDILEGSAKIFDGYNEPGDRF